MAEGGNRPERRGKAFPCQLCHVRSVTRRALGTHYLRAHQRCLEYGSNRPREMDEGEWELKMTTLNGLRRTIMTRDTGGPPMVLPLSPGRREPSQAAPRDQSRVTHL